jgi:predicted  nucleic acid-binding Zn-ribbon protein
VETLTKEKDELAGQVADLTEQVKTLTDSQTANEDATGLLQKAKDAAEAKLKEAAAAAEAKEKELAEKITTLTAENETLKKATDFASMKITDFEELVKKANEALKKLGYSLTLEKAETK